MFTEDRLRDLINKISFALRGEANIESIAILRDKEGDLTILSKKNYDVAKVLAAAIKIEKEHLFEAADIPALKRK